MVPWEESPVPHSGAHIPIREATLPEPPPDPGRCPKCQQRLPPGAEFCLACGTRLVPAKPADRPIPDSPWVPDQCPRCGRPMERGLVLVTDVGDHLLRNPRLVPPLEFVPATADGHPLADSPGTIVHSVPSRREVRSHPEQVLIWYLCSTCRLLHYPAPTLR